jgi:hypothetical protein
MTVDYEVRAAFDSGERTVHKTVDFDEAAIVAQEYAQGNTNSYFVEGAGVEEVTEGRTANGTPTISRFLLAWYDEKVEDVTNERMEV